MPRAKSCKTIIAETLMLIGMVFVVGHMATNFWERFMLQSELTNMKTSLYTLKDAVNNIGNAYDNLYKELQDLAIEDKANKPDSDKLSKKTLPKLETDKLPIVPMKESSTLTKPDEEIQTQSIWQAQAQVQARNLIDILVSTHFEKAVEDFMQQCKVQPVRNTSTLAHGSCPFSSIGLGIKRLDKVPKKLTNCLHKCYNCSISDELIYPALYV